MFTPGRWSITSDIVTYSRLAFGFDSGPQALELNSHTFSPCRHTSSRQLVWCGSIAIGCSLVDS
eukprot:2288581-Amphidinium_carterae.1